MISVDRVGGTQKDLDQEGDEARGPRNLNYSNFCLNISQTQERQQPGSGSEEGGGVGPSRNLLKDHCQRKFGGLFSSLNSSLITPADR